MDSGHANGVNTIPDGRRRRTRTETMAKPRLAGNLVDISPLCPSYRRIISCKHCVKCHHKHAIVSHATNDVWIHGYKRDAPSSAPIIRMPVSSFNIRIRSLNYDVLFVQLYIHPQSTVFVIFIFNRPLIHITTNNVTQAFVLGYLVIRNIVITFFFSIRVVCQSIIDLDLYGAAASILPGEAYFNVPEDEETASWQTAVD